VNRQIRVFGVVMLVLFSALFVQLNYLQVFGADKLNNHPVNSRAVVRDFTQPRGAIQSADGVLLAESVETDNAFKRLRRYPEGELFAHLTGFFSFTYGSDGVERTYNDALTGRESKSLSIGRLSDLLLEKDQTGDVTLTVSKALQETAARELGDRKGAVVALDPRNGAVLAMVDYPSYDPNVLASHDQEEVRQAWDTLNDDPDRPLLPRTYRERYFPGSSFKVVTAAAALATGAASVTAPVYPNLTQLALPQGSPPLQNFGGGSCGGPLPEAMRVSCNTSFAQLGLDMGAERLSGGASAFGFNKVPPIDLPFGVASVFPGAAAFRNDRPALAKSAIGQQDVSATPLQMALVAAGIANGGVVMTPHVMSEVRNTQAEVTGRFEPRPWVQAVPADVARATRDMMVRVVAAGSGTRAQIPGVAVAGKTGTAQTGNNTSHTWFVSFAPADAPRVAVAVMLENQPSSDEFTGGALAAPIAKTVMEAALATP